jgi:hypothetical protein
MNRTRSLPVSRPYPILACLLVCLALPHVALGQTGSESASLSNQPFEANLTGGTTLRLHLRNGDFRVVGNDTDKVSVRAEGKNLEQARKIRIQLRRTGDFVDLRLSHVAKDELQVTIAIPKATNLYARMRGGNLSVEGVAGDKDLALVGGDLTIQVANPADYGHVDLSVSFGDISGSPFGDPKGTMGNSVKQDGSGKYRLHAHLLAGDLIFKN